jgi:copper ion binding protein
MAVTTVYTVAGMTCGHCVAAVTDEVSKLAGVSDVGVDLDTGRVTVTSGEPLAEADVRAAVDEAGYELTSTAT